MEFSHNAFIAIDLDASVDFYIKYCGMQIDREEQALAGGEALRVVYLKLKADGNQYFALIERKESVAGYGDTHDTVGEKEIGIHHFGFDVGSKDELLAIHKRIKEENSDTNEIEEVSEAHERFIVRDPDGRRVEYNWRAK